MYQERVQEFLQELPALREDLPFSPTLFGKLFKQTGANSMSSLEDIAETISSDQGLTTRVLSLANSAYYGLQAEVSSVKRAAAVLGLAEIRNIVLSLGVKGLTEKYPLPGGFDYDEYWRHQFLVATLAEQICREVDEGVPSIMFTAGLLHDIGKLIVAMRRPEDWEAIQALREERECPESEAEDEYWGLDHAVVGALVLKYWDLPPELVEPVNWHHVPALAPEHQSAAAIICLANALVHCMDEGDECSDEVINACGEFRLDVDEIVELAQETMESDTVEHFLGMLSR
ncbi:HDOD domain-containing protein [Pseudodesulfovibrio senegalensis]|jgi:putative nucleotidyltransferase with HDIG domain|uniref:HDOD domain-containing protein n=1 Tax=Pseudodesulfovibrio senegalensis TaxID=1721087 RepID=A0A6N6N4Z1_9BACT|nr:HDOD domain-containing protein [Pseudodesulfovibrio senegalensis]KAB1443310.1 HDOD domain-containing protein [Pseudodesulfovibrio senegalensis]